MRKQDMATTDVRERILGEAMRDVATELRMIDLADLAAFIRLEKFGNLEQLVNSSVELFFDTDAVRFGSAADADLSWVSEPRVSFDMLFRNAKVSVYFRLILEPKIAAVEIDYIEFADATADTEKNTARLEEALSAARRCVGGY